MEKTKAMSAFYEKIADENGYLYFKKYTFKYGLYQSFPHFHNSIEIVIVTKGKCTVFINGIENNLSEGDCVFIDRFDVHYYKYYPDSKFYVFLISEKYLDENNGFDKARLEMFLPKCEKYKQIISLFESAYEFWEDGSDSYREGVVNIILGALSSQYSLTECEEKGDVKTLVNSLIYINENFEKEITLESLSAQLGYSRNYFSTIFNKFTGMNLRTYVNRRRIIEFEHIKETKPDTSVAEAAHKCGFNSLKTFYRAYHKYDNKS